MGDCTYPKKFIMRGLLSISAFPDPEPYNYEENVQHCREGSDENEKSLPSKLDDPSKQRHNILLSPTAHHSDRSLRQLQKIWLLYT